MRKRSESSSSDFPLLSSFMHRTIMTKNSSKSTVPLPGGEGGTAIKGQWSEWLALPWTLTLVVFSLNPPSDSEASVIIVPIA